MVCELLIADYIILEGEASFWGSENNTGWVSILNGDCCQNLVSDTGRHYLWDILLGHQIVWVGMSEVVGWPLCCSFQRLLLVVAKSQASIPAEYKSGAWSGIWHPVETKYSRAAVCSSLVWLQRRYHLGLTWLIRFSCWNIYLGLDNFLNSRQTGKKILLPMLKFWQISFPREQPNLECRQDI